MQAKDIMTTSVVTVSPDSDIRSIARLLVERNISGVPVVDDAGRAVGIVSEGDLMRRHESGTERQPSWWLRLFASPEEQARDYTKSHGMKARDVMTPDVITVREETPLDEIATVLERHRIKRAPVVRDGRVVGIVSRANLLHGLAAGGGTRKVSASDGQIREALDEALSEAGLRAAVINAVVADGVVHMWGAVESDAQKQAARVAAESVSGVKQVRNEIGVLPAIVRTDV